MRLPVGRKLLALAPASALCFSLACSDDDGPAATPDGGGGTGGAAGTAGAAGSAGAPQPGPGELCFDPDPTNVSLRFEPRSTAVGLGAKRSVDLVIYPDFCVPTRVSFEVEDGAVVRTPGDAVVDLLHPRLSVPVEGLAVGSTRLTARIAFEDGSEAIGTLPVDVLEATRPACSGSGSGRLQAGSTVRGTQALASASISLQSGASDPNSGSFLWSVAPFDVTLGCAADQVPAGWDALGPAVTFGPAERKLPREIPFAVPINPALLPDGARLRHVSLAYTGPRARSPRVVPVADPVIVKTDGGFALSFLAPWLGTYQAVVQSDAGRRRHQRRLTYKAVIGVSMGGGGTAMYGLRNHQRYDVLAPLGGPVDWTWLMGHIQRNHIAGFTPNDGVTPPSTLPPLPEPTLPYEHSSSFNRWWYEYPKNGNGGSFPRSEYVQIFRDLALMFGNPNGQNLTPGAENLPAGIAPDDPTVTGNRPGRECAVWVDPIDGHPDNARQRELNDQCPRARCAVTTTLQNYYDDEFNPLGTFPVITVCDGSPQDSSLSPYANTWKPTGNDKPLELALAVDYNGNGQRDEDEPIIRAGHEPFDDVGPDGLPSEQEPGYDPITHLDPAGDDWHPQYNPKGQENNFRWDQGEPFRDHGLDGVPNTASSPYDFGEGDGRFTMAAGLRTFLERDSRTIIEQHPWATQAEPLDDEAFARLDIWTDGGTRDLFNFAVDAQALAGAWAGRGRVVHYYTAFQNIPGQDRSQPRLFQGGIMDFGDIPGGVMLRYGPIDPTPQDIQSGTGQHVGTADDVARRLQSALYYIGSRWKRAPHTLDEAGELNPDPNPPPDCNVRTNTCDFEFTDSRGRKGPVSINLPPGYLNAGNAAKRYPVIFLLHGYGQTPEDLKAAIIFLQNWMNSPLDSAGTRLPKAIMVYVDGRCRPGPVEAECIRGTFFTDSVREHGPKMEAWFNELSDEIDRRFRTLAPETVEWTE